MSIFLQFLAKIFQSPSIKSNVIDTSTYVWFLLEHFKLNIFDLACLNTHLHTVVTVNAYLHTVITVNMYTYLHSFLSA
jgi:hypothetical protein